MTSYQILMACGPGNVLAFWPYGAANTIELTGAPVDHEAYVTFPGVRVLSRTILEMSVAHENLGEVRILD